LAASGEFDEPWFVSIQIIMILAKTVAVKISTMIANKPHIHNCKKSNNHGIYHIYISQNLEISG